MQISKMGLKSVKLESLNETYPAQDILLQTSQIKQYGSGIYAYDNIVLRVQDNIENVIKKHFDKMGAIEVQMPVLQQKQLWERSNRYEKYVSDEVMLTVEAKKGNYCLAPTAEEAITTFVENRVTSYKQLPVYFYQIGLKFRDEIRNRGYLYRGKEFNMFDLYTFDDSEENMEKSYKLIKKVYQDIMEELNLKSLFVAASSGAIGGSMSEECMVLSDSGDDTILYDEETKTGLNIEILEKEDYQNYLKENYNIRDIKKFKEKKALELGHIFALKDKYSKSMNIKFYDKSNQEQNFQMGCYGIGVSRLLGCIYENNQIIENGKTVGFSLPLAVTPYYAYIIYTENKENIAKQLYNQLINKEIKVIIDDSSNTFGEKIKNAKVLGIPYLIILGKNTSVDECEIERTKTKEKKVVKLDECLNVIKSLQETKKDLKF